MRLVISASGPVVLRITEGQAYQKDTLDNWQLSLTAGRAEEKRGFFAGYGAKLGGKMPTLLWCLLCAVGLWILQAWLSYGVAVRSCSKPFTF